MSKVGEPFKMLPLTRKAKNALWQAADLLGIHKDEVMWVLCKPNSNPVRPLLARAYGDEEWDTLRWVQTQDDPDWEIVHPRDSQKELVKERLRGKRERGTLPEWPDDIDAGRL